MKRAISTAILLILLVTLSAPATTGPGRLEQMQQDIDDLRLELAAVQKMVRHKPGWPERVRKGTDISPDPRWFVDVKFWPTDPPEEPVSPRRSRRRSADTNDWNRDDGWGDMDPNDWVGGPG